MLSKAGYAAFGGFVGSLATVAVLSWQGALVPPSGAVLDPTEAAAQFGVAGTTCYAFKVPQADGLGEHLIFCEDGRYGIHDGAAFMPRLYPEEVARGGD